MKRTAAVCVALAAFLWVGCGKSDSNSIVFVTVTAPPTMPVVTRLRAIVSNAGSSDTRFFPQVQSATPIQFDTTFAVTFPTSRSGELEIVVDALNSASQVVASGSDSVVIVPGGRANVIVHLALVATGDAGASDVMVASDVGTAPDTGVADGKSTSDVLQIGTDARELGGVGGILGTGGRYGTGGVTSGGGAIGAGGNPFLGGTTGSTGGIVSSGGVVSTGGPMGSGGVAISGGVTGVDGGGSQPCVPSKTISASGSGNSGSFGTTGAFCFRTSDNISAWDCSNFTGRTLKVNGVTTTCGAKSLPAKVDGYYYFDASAGGVDYASIYWF
jgi:hypothetical protein